jgi:putative addiction module component (TIGR02574 family)
MSAAEELIEAALKLPQDERAKLLEIVSASLDGAGLGEEWEAEIKRRAHDLDSGRVAPVAGDDVFQRR